MRSAAARVKSEMSLSPVHANDEAAGNQSQSDGFSRLRKLSINERRLWVEMWAVPDLSQKNM